MYLNQLQCAFDLTLIAAFPVGLKHGSIDHLCTSRRIRSMSTRFLVGRNGTSVRILSSVELFQSILHMLVAYFTQETLNQLFTVDDHPMYPVLAMLNVPPGVYTCARITKARRPRHDPHAVAEPPVSCSAFLPMTSNSFLTAICRITSPGERQFALSIACSFGLLEQLARKASPRPRPNRTKLFTRGILVRSLNMKCEIAPPP